MKKSKASEISLKRLDTFLFEGSSLLLPAWFVLGMIFDAATKSPMGRIMFLSSIIYAFVMTGIVVGGGKAQRIYAMIVETMIAVFLFLPAMLLIFVWHGFSKGPDIIFRILYRWYLFQMGRKGK